MSGLSIEQQLTAFLGKKVQVAISGDGTGYWFGRLVYDSSGWGISVHGKKLKSSAEVRFKTHEVVNIHLAFDEAIVIYISLEDEPSHSTTST